MRLVLLALVLSACGGGGECLNPPGQPPQATCDSDEDCFETELCDFATNSCGANPNDRGECVTRPTACVEEIEFACGCDGQTYENECVAARAGVDVDIGGGCSAPPNSFACGPRFCGRPEQICGGP